MLDEKTKKDISAAQRNELTEHFIYEKLSGAIKDPHNSEILKRISKDELEHYNFWKRHTQEDAIPDNLKIWKYFLISRLLGVTFGIKLMEKGEEKAQINYGNISQHVLEAKNIAKEEEEHEKQLIGMIDEEHLRYIGSIVLGLNDALVELTGAVAGFTLALQHASLVATAGLITGIAGALSMAASVYLSTKTEGGDNPLKASLYTGATYLLTVLLLIFPFLILDNLYLSLFLTVFCAIAVIFVFNFYISVTRDISFRKRFFEMAFISLGITALTFTIGFLVRIFLKIEV